MFAIVTAATPDYVKKLKWCVPTWVTKPQFKGRKLYLFYSDFADVEKELGWISDYFDTTLIEWDMPDAETLREKMLSCFVLGSSKIVEEEYFVKLDADCYFTDDQDAFMPEDFEVDLCAHKWGYTKPAWWVDKMDAWVAGKRWKEDKSNTGSKGGKRIISWCCLHRTAFVKKCALAAGERLPIPSHDSYLWYMANHFKDCKWKSVNLKSRGVDHSSRWKTIRENVCATGWTPFLTDKLSDNIQLEITTACNLGCPNCDRACGIAPSSECMSVEQVKKFVGETINHRFSRIDIIGGEPTLHRNLPEIFAEIKRYKDKWPRCKIRFSTNGNGPAVNATLPHIPDWVDVRNSAKESKDQTFEAVNIAPVDQGVTDAKACSIPWRCGLALTRYGYFLCGAGASTARVFGLDIGIKSFAELTPDNLKKQRDKLCGLCGHSRSTAKQTDQQELSVSWVEALKTYKENEMVLY